MPKWPIIIGLVGGITIGIMLIGDDTAENTPEVAQDEARFVYATFYPYYEFTSGVAGDALEVRQLVPNGAQVHDWEPNATRIQSLKDSVAIVYSNTETEPYVDRLAGLEEFGGILFIEASPDGGDADIHDNEREEHEEEEDHDEHDSRKSHTWLDPIDVIGQVNRIHDKLADYDPENAETYELNAREYVQQLRELDQRYRDGLRDCQNDTIITFHNAYEHMAERYGLKVFGTASAHHAEASARDIASMIEHARETGVQAIFADELADTRHELAVADEIGVDVIPLSTLEGLRLHEQASYFEKMGQNLDALRDGLRCQ